MSALEILLPYLGAGGATTIVVAYLSYRTAVMKGGRGDHEKAAAAVGISALLADSESVTKLSISLSQVALAADKIALMTEENREDLKTGISHAFKLAEMAIDEMRALRRAVEDKR